MKVRHMFVAAALIMIVSGCGGSGGGSGPQQVRVLVTENGFTPREVKVTRGRPVTLTFERTTEQTCGTDVVFQRLHRGYDLPLNREVKVELSAVDVGDSLAFNCSMDMLHGKIVAK